MKNLRNRMKIITNDYDITSVKIYGSRLHISTAPNNKHAFMNQDWVTTYHILTWQLST